MSRKKKRRRNRPSARQGGTSSATARGNGATSEEPSSAPAAGSRGGKGSAASGRAASGRSSGGRDRQAGRERPGLRSGGDRRQGPRGIFGGRFNQESPFPSFLASMARGVRAVASTPAALALVFGSALALWLTFAAFGFEPSPRLMVNILSLPPMHIAFVDLRFASEASTSIQVAVVIGLVLAILRMFLFGAVVALIAPRLRPDVDLGRPWDLFRRAMPRLALIAAFFYGLVLAAPVLQGVLGPQLGLLLALGVIVIGLYMLVFAPIVAITDHVNYREAIRRSVWAARLPGGSHLAMVFGYLGFWAFLAIITPSAVVAPATPSILTWTFVLLASFLHAGVLAAFTYRWLAVRDEAPEPLPPRTRARRS